MDAYQAPYKGKHRYWPGVILLTCIVQYSVSALNIKGDPIINLLAIIILVTTTNLYKGSVSGVYRKWPLDILETSIHFNLILLSAATMYVTYNDGNQALLVKISLSIYFITCIIIIGYRVLLSIFGNKLKKLLSLKRKSELTYISQDKFRDTDTLQLFDSSDQGLDGNSNAKYHKISNKIIKPHTSAVTYSEIELSKKESR